MIIPPPSPDQDFGFYNNYIQKAGQGDLLSLLQQNLQQLKDMISPLTEEQLAFRYAADKWSVKETLVHLVDSERTFNYRIMRASRGDQGIIPAFDIAEFVFKSRASERSAAGLLAEFELLRKASILMFQEMPSSLLELTSPARDKQVSVRGFGFAMVGHVMHHMGILQEHYLPALAQQHTIA